jgi:hypothetical protein
MTAGNQSVKCGDARMIGLKKGYQHGTLGDTGHLKGEEGSRFHKNELEREDVSLRRGPKVFGKYRG